jgi:predicted acetyltransferase/NTP pyrophosphatase (non-canonical NTP hydrolase)
MFGESSNLFKQLSKVNQVLNRRFPEGNQPYQIMTRLLEEAGELAKEVSHFEGSGVKVEKYGLPERAHFAMEVKHVLLVALQIAGYYHLEQDLIDSVEQSYLRARAEGMLEDEPVFPEELWLIEPTLQLQSEFMAMIEQYRQRGETISYHQQAQSDFLAYLEQGQNMAKGVNLPDGFVPMTSYWLTLQGKMIIGESRLRHTLNPDLEIEGGHIGYAIRPTLRRLGYGTQILALTLEKAREMGLQRVLVTCDTDNIGSARIIEKNGGILESYATSPESGKQISRYWIET